MDPQRHVPPNLFMRDPIFGKGVLAEEAPEMRPSRIREVGTKSMGRCPQKRQIEGELRLIHVGRAEAGLIRPQAKLAGGSWGWRGRQDPAPSLRREPRPAVL